MGRVDGCMTRLMEMYEEQVRLADLYYDLITKWHWELLKEEQSAKNDEYAAQSWWEWYCGVAVCSGSGSMRNLEAVQASQSVHLHGWSDRWPG